MTEPFWGIQIFQVRQRWYLWWNCARQGISVETPARKKTLKMWERGAQGQHWWKLKCKRLCPTLIKRSEGIVPLSLPFSVRSLKKNGLTISGQWRSAGGIFAITMPGWQRLAMDICAITISGWWRSAVVICGITISGRHRLAVAIFIVTGRKNILNGHSGIWHLHYAYLAHHHTPQNTDCDP